MLHVVRFSAHRLVHLGISNTACLVQLVFKTLFQSINPLEAGTLPWFSSFGAADYDREFMNDGEKNFMIFDEDGSISGSANTMIIAKENKPQIRGMIFQSLWLT